MSSHSLTFLSIPIRYLQLCLVLDGALSVSSVIRPLAAAAVRRYGGSTGGLKQFVVVLFVYNPRTAWVQKCLVLILAICVSCLHGGGMVDRFLAKHCSALVSK